jgi:N-methylhydantoinase B
VIRGGSRIRLTRPPRFPLRRGDLVRIVTGGGGGWGDPAARAPADVARDLRDGLLSAEQAAAIYRVAVNPVGEVDDAATARMREGAR